MQKSVGYLLILICLLFYRAINATPIQQKEAYDDILESVNKYLYSNTDSALIFLKHASLLTGDDQLGQLGLYKLYGVYYRVVSKYDSAIMTYQKSADLATQLDQKEAYIDAIHGIGMALSAQGKLAQAEEQLLEALAYYEQNGLLEKQADAYSNIGVVLHKSRDLKGAKALYKKASSIYPGVHYDALSHLAVAYENENSLDSAIIIYDSLSAVYSQSNNVRKLFNVYSNMAIVYEKQGKGAEMIQYYTASVKLAKQLDYVKGLAGVYHNLVRAYFMLGNATSSQAYLDSAYQAATESKDLEIFTKLKGDEAYIAQLNKDYKKAALLYEEFFVLKDSLNAQKQSETVQELNIKYETAANKQRIAELQLEQKDAALSLARANNQRNLFISGFAILLIIAGFLFYQYRTKKRTSDILSAKNEQISEALAEREILLKEIHHRVKNNLQVISSLLYLQAESLEDQVAIDAVRQGQHRVEAMGLIHQRLYSADDVRGVDIQGYFEQLCQEVIVVFGGENSEIDYHIETNQLRLDIDTVIPLGLIVNELITNAIKYAFQGSNQGKISINVNQENEKLMVIVKDNGVGMTEASLKKANSFGWKMMRSLSRKLEAQINIKNESGTTVELIATRYKLVK